MDLGNKMYIAIQLYQALTFMHTSVPPVAHLDIKPSNVMVSYIAEQDLKGAVIIHPFPLRLRRGLGKHI